LKIISKFIDAMKYSFCVLIIFFILASCNQEMSGDELLDNAIKYHDPTHKWNDFKATLFINLETPEKPIRYSKVTIDQMTGSFILNESRSERIIERKIENGECEISMNGESIFSEEDVLKYRLTCERTKFIRNYYTYLYGLPMKLKDEGTIIHPEVQKENFMGTNYLVLKITYDNNVGDDTWYFYFNPKTYAMEAYKFYHDESNNDGEYILLSEILEVNGIKIPKIRKWFVNKNNEFLGSDILTKFEVPE